MCVCVCFLFYKEITAPLQEVRICNISLYISCRKSLCSNVVMLVFPHSYSWDLATTHQVSPGFTLLVSIPAVMFSLSSLLFRPEKCV